MSVVDNALENCPIITAMMEKVAQVKIAEKDNEISELKESIKAYEKIVNGYIYSEEFNKRITRLKLERNVE